VTSATLNPIDIEAAIVDRLNLRLRDAGVVKFVYDTKAYAAVEEESQLVPAVAVIYNGYRTSEQLEQGSVQAVELEFLVVAVTRSSTQTLRATGAKAAAGEIFHETVQALIGWKPAPGLRRLKLADAPGAGFSGAGFTYLPIAFNTRITYTPQP
jgi:hypothetical protein